MKAPLFVRPLSTQERQALQAGLRAREAFTLRRCQILLASADGKTATEIAALFGCATQTVRNTLRAFAAEGLACLSEKSHRPKRVRPFARGHAGRALAHLAAPQSPRFRQAHQPVDFEPGRRGGLRAGADRAATEP
ncbi:helix-turn-helix domain-containing protein [Azotobacter beijerinckii]|uniref:helix-turn-helix domain-containing protein n=1 Tax=Azotobacter beijerinckii TaxID=170623 RepID=UPI0037BEE777